MPFGVQDIPWVNVAYCTKQIDRIDRYSFVIDDPEDMAACGLFETTLVVTSKITGLPGHLHCSCGGSATISVW